MLGWPTIREGQEKREEGNSPKHSGPSFRCSCLIRFSTNNVYIVEISSVFADNVSAMVRFEWNSVFWIITKYIFWPPLCLVRQRMKSPRRDFVFQDLEETLLLTLHVKGIFEEKRCPSLGCSSKSRNSPNHPGSIFKFSCLISFSNRRCLYSQRELCICRQCVSNGKIWIEFIVLSHHQI